MMNHKSFSEIIKSSRIEKSMRHLSIRSSDCCDSKSFKSDAKMLSSLNVCFNPPKDDADSKYKDYFDINLYIEDKVSHFGTFLLSVHPEMNLYFLKMQVEQELGIPLSAQKWIFSNKLVENDCLTLGDCGILPNSSVFLYIDSDKNKCLQKQNIEFKIQHGLMKTYNTKSGKSDSNEKACLKALNHNQTNPLISNEMNCNSVEPTVIQKQKYSAPIKDNMGSAHVLLHSFQSNPSKNPEINSISIEPTDFHQQKSSLKIPPLLPFDCSSTKHNEIDSNSVAPTSFQKHKTSIKDGSFSKYPDYSKSIKKRDFQKQKYDASLKNVPFQVPLPSFDSSALKYNEINNYYFELQNFQKQKNDNSISALIPSHSFAEDKISDSGFSGSFSLENEIPLIEKSSLSMIPLKTKLREVSGLENLEGEPIKIGLIRGLSAVNTPKKSNLQCSKNLIEKIKAVKGLKNLDDLRGNSKKMSSPTCERNISREQNIACNGSTPFVVSNKKIPKFSSEDVTLSVNFVDQPKDLVDEKYDLFSGGISQMAIESQTNGLVFPDLSQNLSVQQSRKYLPEKNTTETKTPHILIDNNSVEEGSSKKNKVTAVRLQNCVLENQAFNASCTNLLDKTSGIQAPDKNVLGDNFNKADLSSAGVLQNIASEIQAFRTLDATNLLENDTVAAKVVDHSVQEDNTEKDQSTAITSLVLDDAFYITSPSTNKEDSDTVPDDENSEKNNNLDHHNTKTQKELSCNKLEDDLTKNFQVFRQIENLSLVKNIENFSCPICFQEVESGKGVVLHECLHTFCIDCLQKTVEYSEDIVVTCPFRNVEYSCSYNLQHREIKALVSEHVYERYLQRSMNTAKSIAEKSFHCKTLNCEGWCMFEENLNIYHCPVCLHYNCLNCNAIHEGLNCKQYQEKNQKEYDRDSEKSLALLNKLIEEGKAMRCPKCDLILMKRWGCDWLKCGVCLTEICWITKGPRWGPAGQGDTSAGCKCGVNGIKCHPSCTYCH